MFMHNDETKQTVTDYMRELFLSYPAETPYLWVTLRVHCFCNVQGNKINVMDSKKAEVKFTASEYM